VGTTVQGGNVDQGAGASDSLGASVSGAGDVNGDGFDDVIMGAPYASPNNRSRAGAVYVILENATGLATVDLAGFNSSDSTGFIIWGAAEDDYLGISVSGAGDVNGDGFDDVIMGASYGDPNDRSAAGAVYVILGKASGFVTVDLANFTSSNSTGFIVQGAAEDDYLGRSVSGAGDVNGDGFDDVIMGAPWADPNDRSAAGAVYVTFGKAGGSATVDLAGFVSSDSTGFIVQGAAGGDNLGRSVSGAGDVNGDGFDDVLMGAVGAFRFEKYNGWGSAYAFAVGAAYVIFGKAGGFATWRALRPATPWASWCKVLEGVTAGMTNSATPSVAQGT
jgi:hypothetical protein